MSCGRFETNVVSILSLHVGDDLRRAGSGGPTGRDLSRHKTNGLGRDHPIKRELRGAADVDFAALSHLSDLFAKVRA